MRKVAKVADCLTASTDLPQINFAMKFTTAATAIVAVAAATAPAIVHARISGVGSRDLAKGGNGGGGNGGGKPNTEEGPADCVPCKDCFCTADYTPVCGVDGETYGNVCKASNACVEVASKGVCNTDGTGSTTITLCDVETNEGCSDSQVCFPLRGTGPLCYDCDCKGGQVCGVPCGLQDVPPSCIPKKSAC